MMDNELSFKINGQEVPPERFIGVRQEVINSLRAAFGIEEIRECNPIHCAVVDVLNKEAERWQAISKRTYDYFIKEDRCPYGSPGWERPCAGAPMHERQCKACIAEFCGYAEEP